VSVGIWNIFVIGAQDIVDAIDRFQPGDGNACWKQRDVTSLDDQVALFEFAVAGVGGVDIVVSVDLLWVRSTLSLLPVQVSFD
jgi:NAD(P)-dependent dehydrogenase (short-subunit alcohol dehydrogenase family)